MSQIEKIKELSDKLKELEQVTEDENHIEAIDLLDLSRVFMEVRIPIKGIYAMGITKDIRIRDKNILNRLLSSFLLELKEKKSRLTEELNAVNIIDKEKSAV